MVDLDLKDFVSRFALEKELARCLKRIEKTIASYPTVLWTGNGYHIPGALEGKDLENVPFLISLKKYFCHNLTSLFMQFTERYFAKKCDKNHISTVQSCLTRVPATLNTKHTVNDTFQEVRVIQRWDGVRANLNCLIRPFRTYLVDKKIKILDLETKFCGSARKSYSIIPYQIQWIERLLQTSIWDFRKNAVSLILAPYLINTKKLSYEESYRIIMNWLQVKCSALCPLNFNARHIVKYSLNYAKKNGYKPMSLETLKQRNSELIHTLFTE